LASADADTLAIARQVIFWQAVAARSGWNSGKPAVAFVAPGTEPESLIVESPQQDVPALHPVRQQILQCSNRTATSNIAMSKDRFGPQLPTGVYARFGTGQGSQWNTLGHLNNFDGATPPSHQPAWANNIDALSRRTLPRSCVRDRTHKAR
jgi:hypothetical protein